MFWKSGLNPSVGTASLRGFPQPSPLSAEISDTLPPPPHHHLPTHLSWPVSPGSPFLLEAVGSSDHPAVSDEGPPTDVSATNLEAGLPRPLASLHVPATIDPPHHLGFPAHCGNSAATYNRDTVGAPNVTTRKLSLLHRWENQGQASSSLAKRPGV